MKHAKSVFLLITFLLLSSCAVKMVAEYDYKTADKIVEISRSVDLFYILLAEADVSDRQYKYYKHSYIEIELELRQLIMLNKMRPKNEAAIQTSENILQNWLEFKAAHKENDSYKNAMIDIDRHTIREQFCALAVAEAAKK